MRGRSGVLGRWIWAKAHLRTDWYDPDVAHDLMKLALVEGACELVVWHGTGA